MQAPHCFSSRESSMDKSQRLFMAALGNHTVEVLDLQSAKRIRSIPDVAEPQGVSYGGAHGGL
jgi:hypothetical protein